jgi:hypothetical protein
VLESGLDMLKVGKLYSCSKYFLLLYPDRKTAARGLDVAAASAARRAAAPCAASYWTKKLQKPVSFCNTETPLLILSADKEYVEVLAEDKRGWIINEDWLELKEIAYAAA